MKAYYKQSNVEASFLDILRNKKQPVLTSVQAVFDVTYFNKSRNVHIVVINTGIPLSRQAVFSDVLKEIHQDIPRQ